MSEATTVTIVTQLPTPESAEFTLADAAAVWAIQEIRRNGPDKVLAIELAQAVHDGRAA